MDFEREMEFDIPKPVNKESSYSEEEQSKIIEGSVMDMKQSAPSASSGQAGNKRKPIEAVSRKEKIISSYKANLEKLLGLVEAISALDGKNYRQEEQIVEEIRALRHLQEELLNALVLEGKGMLNEESISKEAWNLIQ